MPDTLFPFLCGICCKHFQSLVCYFDHFSNHQLNISNFLHNTENDTESNDLTDKKVENVLKFTSFKCLDCQNIIPGICKTQEHILLQNFLSLTCNSSEKDTKFTHRTKKLKENMNINQCVVKDKLKSTSGAISGNISNEVVTDRNLLEISDNGLYTARQEDDIERSNCFEDGDSDKTSSSRDKNEILSVISDVQTPDICVARKTIIESAGSEKHKEAIFRDDDTTNYDRDKHRVIVIKKQETQYTNKGMNDNDKTWTSFGENSQVQTAEKDDNLLNFSETEVTFVQTKYESNHESIGPIPSTSSQNKGNEELGIKENLTDVPPRQFIIDNLDASSGNIEELHQSDVQLIESTNPTSSSPKEVKEQVDNVDVFGNNQQKLDDPADVECVENKMNQKIRRKKKCTPGIRGKEKKDDKLPCDMCGILFDKKNFHRHRLSHTDVKTHKCNICNKYFKTKDQLYSHKLFHNTRKDQMCHYCGKAFNNGPNLRQHVKIHTREKTLKCPFCPKMFRSNFILKDHVNRHSDNKPFICEHCGKSFRTGNELQRHALVHSNERPHPCSLCDKTFKSRSNRIKHEKTHKT